LRIFFSRPTLWIIHLQNRVIDYIKYSILLGWGAARDPESSINMALLFERALLEARPDRQDITLKLQKQVASSYK
jgi:hypothetical protein